MIIKPINTNSIYKKYIILSYAYTNSIYNFLKVFFALTCFLSFGILIYNLGYRFTEESESLIKYIKFIIYFFLIYEIINIFFYRNNIIITIITYLVKRKYEIFFTILLFILVLLEQYIIKLIKLYTGTNNKQTMMIFLSFAQFLILLNNIIRVSRNISNIQYKKISPSFLFLLSFLIIISLGLLLLSSPKTHNTFISFIDVLFTVVSAVCVTGLSTIDIGKDLNFAGQVILLFLIQIGGLGLMTLTSFFSYYLSGQVSLTNQIIMKEIINEISLLKVKKTLKDIIIFTFTIELIGAIILWFTLPDNVIPVNQNKFFYALFHSISAFCNAGFSLFSDSLMNLSRYSPISIYIIMTIIVFGGIGFPVINEVTNKIKNKRYRFSLTSKLVIISNGIIYFFSFFIFIYFSYFYNFNLTFSEKILHGFVYAITPRTAGFNTLSYENFPIPLIFFTFLLMWIGASPVSTGGGIKTTTITIGIFHIVSLLRGRTKVEIFKKRLSEETIIRSYTTILLSLMVIFLGIFLISIFEKLDFLKITFEVVSAFGTVGLSLGITTQLSPYSKIIICILMLTGRIGIITMLLAIIPKVKEYNYEYPTEYVITG